MVPISYTMNLDASSATKVAAAQTIGGAGNLVLTAAAGSGLDSSGAARIILFTTTEDDSGVNYTMTGTDANGNTISEGPTALPTSTTKASALAYATVTQIHVTGAIAANISVGTTNTTSSAIGKMIALNHYNRIAHQVAVELSGTATYSIKETFSPIMDGTVTANNAVLYAGPSVLTAATASKNAQVDVGVTGLQLSVASYTTGAKITVRIIAPSQGST